MSHSTPFPAPSALSPEELIRHLCRLGGADQEESLRIRNALLDRGQIPDQFLTLSQQELSLLLGSDSRAALFVSLAIQLFQWYITQPSVFSGKDLSDGSAAPFLYDPPVEEAHLFYLDKKLCAAARECLAKGSACSVVFSPRQVTDRLCHHPGKQALLVHNHPDGCKEVSAADKQIVQWMKCSTALVDLSVPDQGPVCHGAVPPDSGTGQQKTRD